ncbi:carboxyltransferase domain-containing protein [Sulfurimonas sp. MAG313]|nr:carboxyltransferase domain-containing protein [Sulfurimonas sp. MAG313]MDF1880284.1 carboxyltransferase domain-containing protein [Sulfurimonas sp. MAG313]
MFEVKEINETLIEYVFGSSISIKTNQKALQVYKYLKDEHILDLVPTYTSLAVHFTSQCKLFSNIHALDDEVRSCLEKEHISDSKEYVVNVDYRGEDIEKLCKDLLLTKDELIRLHTQAIYTVCMLGFQGYFPYLLGLDKRLNISRRESPRLKVKKGAVAIATGQCGIYSKDSPGGWHILGYTNFNNFASLLPSDTIIFRECHVD